MRSSTETLVKALRILARDIQSGDGVANAAIAEGAERLAELERENAALRADKERLDWFLKLGEDDRVAFCRGWYRWTPETVKAEIDAELRKEAQP